MRLQTRTRCSGSGVRLDVRILDGGALDSVSVLCEVALGLGGLASGVGFPLLKALAYGIGFLLGFGLAFGSSTCH